MSHAVERMFYVGEVPWHGLGRQVSEAPTTADGIRLAGLDWTVSTRQLQLPATATSPARPVTQRAMVRDSDESVLGFVGPHYRPLQNVDAFKFFDKFLDSGEVRLETAGSLRKGKRVWVLAKLNRAPLEVVPGDVVEKYLLLSNGHDGLNAVRVGLTPVRVVCQNTLSAAEYRTGTEARDSQLIRIHHNSNLSRNLTDVASALNAVDARFEASAELFRALARRGVNQADVKAFVREVFVPEAISPHTTTEDMERLEVREKKMLETITRLFESGRGNDTAHVRGTAWALYNAATEYLTHEAGRSSESRLNQLWFDQGAASNSAALRAALKVGA